MTDYVHLFHGTCAQSAKSLLSYGWSPDRGRSGGNLGQARFLYLTNDPENALWFAQEKGCGVVLRVEVPMKHLQVDPEDGTHETVKDELSMAFGLPGSVVATRAIPATCFSVERGMNETDDLAKLKRRLMR